MAAAATGSGSRGGGGSSCHGQNYQVVRIGHSKKMAEALEAMLQEELMCDVTVVCEGQSVRAHRIILAANSAYFKEVFRATPAGYNPIVFLKNFSVDDLNDILGFLYKGEVVVPSHRLASIIEAAKSLGISGLSGLNLSQPHNSHMRVSSSGHGGADELETPSTTPIKNSSSDGSVVSKRKDETQDKSIRTPEQPEPAQPITKLKLRSWSQQISSKNLRPPTPAPMDSGGHSKLKIEQQRKRGRPKKTVFNPMMVKKRGRPPLYQSRPPLPATAQSHKQPKLTNDSPKTSVPVRRTSSRFRSKDSVPNGDLARPDTNNNSTSLPAVPNGTVSDRH